MKIGILTYHWVPNFGAQMQTFASVCRLRAMGHEPVVLDWRPADAEIRYMAGIPPMQLEQHNVFAQSFPLSPLCRTQAEVDGIARDMGLRGILVGSDSLFNLTRAQFSFRRLRWIPPTSDHIFPNLFWEPTSVENIPYAAISVSSQNSNYHRFADQRKTIASALKRFCYVSVRDEWTRKLVAYFTDGAVMPSVTPDPVFSMEQNHVTIPPKGEILSRFGLPEHYVLMSACGRPRTSITSKWQRGFIQAAKREGLTCVEFPRAQGCQQLKTKIRIALPLSPLDWYALIRYSSGFVGMLMHPLIVALHNAVPCFSFDIYGISRGLHLDRESSKIYLLLKELGLEGNRCSVADIFSWPRPERVLEILLSFDRESCRVQMKNRSRACVSNYERAVAALGDFPENRNLAP